jgi:ferric-dicitrate binding protein FerR (iron transport regulator)
MNNDLLNILSNSNKDIDNQKLMDYLSGKLSEQEKHEVEEWMVDNEFENEALEGLQQLAGKKNLEGYVDQLNKELHQYIRDKKSRREKRKIDNSFWVYTAIVFILLVIILAWMVISRLHH